MNNKIKWFSVVLLLLFITLNAFPIENQNLILSDDLSYVFVTHYADYLTDKTGAYTIDEVSSPDFSNSFLKMNWEGRITKESNAVWIRFRLKNQSSDQNSWILEYDYSKQNIKLEFYIPTGDKSFQMKRAYPGMPASESDFRHRNHVFQFPLDIGQEQTFYIKATVRSDLYLVLKIWQSSVFRKTVNGEQFFFGLFIGIVLIMALYNLFLFFSFRDLSYIYYILFILSISILQLNNHRILSEWVAAIARYDTDITVFMKLFTFIFFLMFAKSFLSIRKYLPRLNSIFSILITLVVLTGILSLPINIFKTANSLLMAISGILSLVAAGVVIKKGNRTGIYFISATASLILFGMLVMVPAESYYVKEINFFVPYFIDIGCLLMIVLFSFGLSYRINVLRKEKEHNLHLKEKESMKSRFLTNMSHEFRTPLTLINAPLTDMIMECENPDRKRTYNLMLRNSNRLLGMVNQLLDLSKLENSSMKANLEKTDLVILIKGIAEGFRYLTEKHKLQLTVKADSPEIQIYLDTGKFDRICMNLLMNAIKFTPEDGEISIRCSINGSGKKQQTFPQGYAEISFSNTGTEIPSFHKEHIFDLFYQAEKRLNQNYSGFGLGLPLVKKLVLLHCGIIDVTSGENGTPYTTFTIRLPLGKEHFETADTAGEKSDPHQKTNNEHNDLADKEEMLERIPIELKQQETEKETILIIEDDPDLRAYMQERLSKNFNVLLAPDGEQGIEKANKEMPDIIISDIMMPGIDGYDVVKKLKSNIETSHIPIILLTAKTSEESIIKGLEIEADAYITKPFSMNILEAHIINKINTRRQLQDKLRTQFSIVLPEENYASIDRDFMESLNNTVELNISDPQLNIQMLTENLFLSKATLNRKIRALSGLPTNEYIKLYRLQKAAQLLQAKAGNVTEICFKTGFSSAAYFSKCFKETFQQTPSQYQDAHAE